MDLNHVEELEELALGHENIVYVEGLLAAALEPHVAAFHAGHRDDHTMRCLRTFNDCNASIRRSKKSAEAIREAIAAIARAEGKGA